MSDMTIGRCRFGYVAEQLRLRREVDHVLGIGFGPRCITHPPLYIQQRCIFASKDWSNHMSLSVCAEEEKPAPARSIDAAIAYMPSYSRKSQSPNSI
jgi:hypothetical protein